MGRRVALTALMTDPGVEAAGEVVAAPAGPAPGSGPTGQPGSVTPSSVELSSSPADSMERLSSHPSSMQPGVSHTGSTKSGVTKTSATQPGSLQAVVQADAERIPTEPPTRQARAHQPTTPAPDSTDLAPVHSPSTRSAHTDANPEPTRPTSVVRAPGASSVRSVTRARVSDRTVQDRTNAASPIAGRAIVDGPTVDLTSRAPAYPQAETDDSGEEELLFSDLERKEARLRWDQIEDLSRLAKRLNRARRGQPGRRITENTLIRVALDYLLENQGELVGRTEAELLDDLRAAR